MVAIAAVLAAVKVEEPPTATVVLLLLLYNVAVAPSDDEFLFKAAGSVVMELDEVIVAKAEVALSSNEVTMVASEEVTDRVNEVVDVEESGGEVVELAEDALEGGDPNDVAPMTGGPDFVLLLAIIAELSMLVVDPPGDTGVSDPVVSDIVTDGVVVAVELVVDVVGLDIDEASNAETLSA